MKTTSLTVVMTVVVCAPALAQQRPDLADRFKQFDKDGDGKVTPAEMGNPELHRRLDKNGDGVVTLEEARGAVRAGRAARETAAATPATIPEGVDVNAKPSAPPAEPLVSKSRAFTDLVFSRDCEPGTKDLNGRRIGGTETMRFLCHKGKLFAGTGCWMDLPYGPRPADNPPWTGPQILVKESAGGPWRVDVSFPKAVRVDAMVSATFVVDSAGRKLEPPVCLLIVSPSSQNTATWTRDDATGTWTESPAVEGLLGGLRSFHTHGDAKTGRQYLFGGSTKGSIFRAEYDPAAPGKLRWHKEPELSGTGRFMCMAEADGVLYAAGGIKSEETLSGGLFRRVDGEAPRWDLLWRWPHLIREKGDETEILRGLTAIPDPSGGGRQALLGTCNYPGVVYRIDPKRNLAVTTELDIRAYFAKVFGAAAPLRGPCLSAYNNFLPVVHPDTGERAHLLGLWINHPAGRGTELGSGAWYLVRHADGSYSHGRVFDPKHPKPNPPRGLLATRTIEISPFPEDRGRSFYFGGYDCASIESRDTAWFYKGSLPSPKESTGGGR
jgi:hypothetical protein